MITNRSLTSMMRLNLSLVFASFLWHLVHNIFKDRKVVNITIFHIRVLNIGIVNGILFLNEFHFFLALDLIFSFNNCLQFLRHVSRILTFQKLLVNSISDRHLILKMIVRIVRLFVNTAISWQKLLLINLNFCGVFRVGSTQLGRVTIKIIVQHAHVHSLIRLKLRKMLSLIKVLFRHFFSNLLKFKETLLSFLDWFVLVCL